MLKKVTRRIWRNIRSAVAGLWWYPSDFFKYKKLMRKQGLYTLFYYFPQIFDKTPESHTFDKHYVYMDRWAFQYLLVSKPGEHIDVGSSIRFLSMATTVTKVKFVDIRPINVDFDNFECVTGSILAMPFPDNSLNSLSCLHVAEHIGLGRYGDLLDPLGTQKACKELARVLKPGGKLYFAGPIGKTATYFNAHRVHDPELILEYFADLKLEDFAAVNDQGHFLPSAETKDFKQAAYSCGCFVFTKK